MWRFLLENYVILKLTYYNEIINKKVADNKKNSTFWLCRCDCGKEREDIFTTTMPWKKEEVTE